MKRNKNIMILNCTLDGIKVLYPEDEKPHISDYFDMDKVEPQICRHRTIPFEGEV